MLAPFEAAPRPRQMSIKLTELLMAVGLYLAVNAFVMYCILSNWPKSQQPSLSVKVFLYVWAFLMIYIPIESVAKAVRDRWLLMNGEVALGQIFHITKGRHSRMEFRFEDRTGRAITASTRAQPRPRSVSEGSAIVVFYDPANPEKRSVPLCRAIWRVDLPASASEIPRSASSA